jgi:hypothetical protein
VVEDQKRLLTRGPRSRPGFRADIDSAHFDTQLTVEERGLSVNARHSSGQIARLCVQTNTEWCDRQTSRTSRTYRSACSAAVNSAFDLALDLHRKRKLAARMRRGTDFAGARNLQPWAAELEPAERDRDLNHIPITAVGKVAAAHLRDAP